MAAKGWGISFWGDENMLELDSGNGCATLGMYCTTLTCTR